MRPQSAIERQAHISANTDINFSFARRLRRWFSARGSAWSGIASELLSELTAGTEPLECQRWPEDPQAVVRYLERNSETLHSWGVAIQFHEQDYGPCLISIRWVSGFPKSGYGFSFINEQELEPRAEQVPDLPAQPQSIVGSEAPDTEAATASSADVATIEESARVPPKPVTPPPDWHDIRNSLQGFDACNTVPTKISHRIMNTVLVILFAISMLLLLTWYRQTQAEYTVNAQRQSYEANSSSEAGSTLSRPEQQFGSSVAQTDAGSEDANFAPKPVVTASTPQVGTEAEIKSIEWAAQHGDADAQYQLANLLAQGRGVPQDLVSAYAWYVIADAAGNPNSKDAMKQLTAKLPPDGIASVRSKLGQMYATGFGVPKDYTKAYTWFSLAEAAGDQQSEHEKMLLAQKMTEQEIAEGSNRASDWLKKH